MHMPNPTAYDQTLKEILTEEFFRAQVTNPPATREGIETGRHRIGFAGGRRSAYDYLKDMGHEDLVSTVFINRAPY